MATATGRVPVLWFVLAAAALLFVAVYVASPWLALNSLKSAAMSGDADRLDELVDFPAVRASLKEQLSATMMAEIRNNPDVESNPFAGLALMMMPAVIDQAIDAYVTPAALSEMVSTAKSPGPDLADGGPNQGHGLEEPHTEPNTKFGYAYISMNRFRASMANEDAPENRVALILERRGIFRWQLIRIRLPSPSAERPAHATAGETPAPSTADASMVSPGLQVFRGRGDGSDVEVSLKPEGGGRYWFEAVTATEGCAGSMEGAATEADGLLIGIPEDEGEPDQSCRLTMRRTSSGLEVEEGDCPMWHGFACRFDATLTRVD